MKLDVNVLRYLSKEDFRVLTAVEMGQKNVRRQQCTQRCILEAQSVFLHVSVVSAARDRAHAAHRQHIRPQVSMQPCCCCRQCLGTPCDAACTNGFFNLNLDHCSILFSAAQPMKLRCSGGTVRCALGRYLMGQPDCPESPIARVISQ